MEPFNYRNFLFSLLSRSQRGCAAPDLAVDVDRSLAG